MNLIYVVVLFITALIIQSSILPVILPYWFAAGINLAVIVLVHIAITRGPVQGMVAGLVLGYFEDALSGGVLGVSGISFILAGFVGGVLSRRLYMGSLAPRASCIVITVMTLFVTRVFVMGMFGLPGIGVLSTLFLWAVLGNALFSLVFDHLLFKLELAIGVRSAEEISVRSV